MDGFKRNRAEKAIRVALEFQQERGVPLDRPAFERMERAAARMIRMPDVGELTDLELAKILIVDSSIQKIAGDALKPGARSEERCVGKECVSTCRSRWLQDHSKKDNKTYGVHT